MLHRILSLSTSLSPHLLSSPSPRLQGMEFVEGEFGGGFGPATAAGDEFFVDEFLDFSNECSEIEESPPQLPEPRITCSVSLEKQAATMAPLPSLSTEDDFGSIHEEAESLESLEWLSHFVEDSFSDYSLAGKFPLKPAENRSETAAEVKEQPCFTTPVQTKARTKRARTSLRVWPVLSPSSSSSSSSTSSTTSFYPSRTGESVKKPKSKPADGGGGGAGLPRRCSHCGVTKTPQWRAGPLGSKTLCNACGVRFKSGRLLPEYRPACSPTFSSEMHSNNHRKVLEMRRKKEVETGVTGLPPPVQSF